MNFQLLPARNPIRKALLLFVCMGFSVTIWSQSFKEYRGMVIDSNTRDPLVFATLSVNGTNISTITNNDGQFLLKIPDNLKGNTVTISFLGYQKKVFDFTDLETQDMIIKLEMSVTELAEVDVSIPGDALTVVKNAFKNKGKNNPEVQTLMTAFYREIIKKRRKNASLTEAVVNIYKQSYTAPQRDMVQLYKARKSTDYSKLDTIALKLMGGPFNTLYGDMMKYPDYIFADETLDEYNFSFEGTTMVNEHSVYVIRFEGKPGIEDPLYYGKLYIASDTYALTRAVYNLNVENRKLASKYFVRKKPADVDVYPLEAAYRVDYREKDGKWYYGYSSVQLEFKVDRKGKLFNSIYSLTSEMAITDWELNPDGEGLRARERMKPSIVINDEASGFSDPEFWGAYNVIEPEKSIESAIDKINRQFLRAKRKEERSK